MKLSHGRVFLRTMDTRDGIQTIMLLATFRVPAGDLVDGRDYAGDLDGELGRFVIPQLQDVTSTVPRGMDADQILTGELFGMVSTTDRETLALLDRHRQLLREQPGSAEVRTLEEALRTRLGSFADGGVERLAHRVAAEVIDREVASLTREGREEARRLIHERVEATRGGR